MKNGNAPSRSKKIILATCAALTVLPIIAVGSAAASTDGANLKVRAFNVAEPSIQSTAGLQRSDDSENPRVVTCFVIDGNRSIVLDEELRAHSEENLVRYLAALDAAAATGVDADFSALKNNSDGIALAIEKTRDPHTGETLSTTVADAETPLKDLFFLVLQDDGYSVSSYGCAAQDI